MKKSAQFAQFAMSFATMAVFGLALVGCKSVRTPDGEVPAGYVEVAKKFEGVYTGAFNGQKGDLTIQVDGNRPVVTFHGEHGDDLIGAGCGSMIGGLASIEIRDDHDTLRVSGVNFHFDPHFCKEVQGRMLTMYFREKDGQMHLSASILKNLYSDECFPGSISAPVGLPSDSLHRCSIDDREEYLTGKFIRN